MERTFAERKPRPSGLNGTNPTRYRTRFLGAEEIPFSRSMPSGWGQGSSSVPLGSPDERAVSPAVLR